MKKAFILALAALLLCIVGCVGKEPPAPAENDGLLTMEELIGKYDISYQSEAESGIRTVDIVILNDRLTYVLDPKNGMDSENSFDSYDPQTGSAKLQRSYEEENGTLSIACELVFEEKDRAITVSGAYVITREDTAEETYTLSGSMN